MRSAAYMHVARVGRALASSHRLEILDLLGQGEKSVEALARELGLTLANTSQHLQVLRQARLVTARREGRSVLYGLSDLQVAECLVLLRRLAERLVPDVEHAIRSFLRGWADVRPLDRRTVRRRWRRGEVVLLDVRPASEYRVAHLAGALSIPLPELERRLQELPRGKVIVAYCRGPYCTLALEAVRLLRAHGFRAYRLVDGVQELRLEGWPLEAGGPAA